MRSMVEGPERGRKGPPPPSAVPLPTASRQGGLNKFSMTAVEGSWLNQEP